MVLFWLQVLTLSPSTDLTSVYDHPSVLLAIVAYHCVASQLSDKVSELPAPVGNAVASHSSPAPPPPPNHQLHGEVATLPVSEEDVER